mgnify:CR=1 FL=1
MRSGPRRDIRISHEPLPTNAALWAADIVAGAVAAQLHTDERMPLNLTGLTEIHIRP